jgi:hypothetical protein
MKKEELSRRPTTKCGAKRQPRALSRDYATTLPRYTSAVYPAVARCASGFTTTILTFLTDGGVSWHQSL